MNLRVEYSLDPALKSTVFQIWNDDLVTDRPYLSFGKKKAQAIVECIDDIREFVENE